MELVLPKYWLRVDGRLFKSLTVFAILISEISDLSCAAFRVIKNNTANWHVKALVDATPISGPA